jgi:vacuolar-type H+-ATPase subunit F/Vma7
LHKVLGIFPEDLAAGFALTGLEVIRVKDAEAGRGALLEAVANQEYGLLIIEENLLAAMEEGRSRELLERNSPLVIPIPGMLRWADPERGSADDYVAALIRRAVGYQMNIKL